MKHLTAKSIWGSTQDKVKPRNASKDLQGKSLHCAMQVAAPTLPQPQLLFTTRGALQCVPKPLRKRFGVVESLSLSKGAFTHIDCLVVWVRTKMLRRPLGRGSKVGWSRSLQALWGEEMGGRKKVETDCIVLA